jgi:hypothetical protein
MGVVFQPYAPAALPPGKRTGTHFTGAWHIFLEESEKKFTKFIFSVVDIDTANRTQYFFDKKQECYQINSVFSLGVSESVTMRAGLVLSLTTYLAFRTYDHILAVRN